MSFKPSNSKDFKEAGIKNVWGGIDQAARLKAA